MVKLDVVLASLHCFGFCSFPCCNYPPIFVLLSAYDAEVAGLYYAVMPNDTGFQVSYAIQVVEEIICSFIADPDDNMGQQLLLGVLATISYCLLGCWYRISWTLESVSLFVGLNSCLLQIIS